MTDLKITEATVQLVVNEQEPVFLQVLRGPIVVSGGGGVTVHNDLTGRSDADAHPISSITGLAAALAAAGNVDSVNGQTGTVSLDLDDLTGDRADRMRVGGRPAGQVVVDRRASPAAGTGTGDDRERDVGHHTILRCGDTWPGSWARRP